MTALVDAIAPPRSRAVAVAAVAAALAVVAGGAALAVAQPWRAAAAGDPCAPPAGELAGIWDDVARGRVQAALGASVAPAIAARLDAYAASWLEDRVAACRATRVEHVQSEQLLDLRARCLRTQAQSVATAVAAIVGAGSAAVPTADSLDGVLAPLAACDDGDALASDRVVPPDPALAPRIAEVRRLDAQAKLLDAGDQVRPAFALVTRAVADARAIGYAPVLAEALLARGELLIQLADDDGAQVTRPDIVACYDEAARVAEAGDDDHDRVVALAELADEYAGEGDDDKARVARQDAIATASRGHSDADTRARRGELEAQLALADDPQKALAAVRGTEELRDANGTATIESRAIDTELEVRALFRLKRTDEVHRVVDRVAAMFEAAATTETRRTDAIGELASLAHTVSTPEDFVDAAALQRRALALADRLAKPLSITTAMSLRSGYARSLANLDDPGAAAAFQAALAIEAGYGAEQAATYTDMLVYFRAHARYGEAVDAAKHALAADPTSIPGLREGIVGVALVSAGNLAEARTYFETALAKCTQVQRDHPNAVTARQLAVAQMRLADVLVETGAVARGRALVEAAMPTLELYPDEGKTQLAQGRFALARAIADGDPARAATLVASARAGYDTGGAPWAVVRVDKWLAAHPKIHIETK